ncbi:hypothetical protein MTX26_35660 (plasmid) [Bradyrhizobium sp. ISRA443]|uniref:hypothetical protein n=1 Tax=unclassified Bradyrhizobium TaxID=2631580 RepID=UPI00247905E3|nr:MULTISPECIES: hypothetical protein [unclassified Bradyrhizobium]WGR90762.1 hypothetical protein MTX20_00050 [Bradyrhizobium sp. ISRA435]WGS03106.1 hypothetical protein MTX23_34960 [Bradyrhizobium sp. ISRA436]WGS09861.1 hypothetical protein MTX18_35655 [Bradyrhizobium sp. ISRA437]WGS16746.1 hypothetical protein MTX26_35660 [Bradyrhizobium sp. ISRA443]
MVPEDDPQLHAFIDDCCELKLQADEVERLHLDRPDILLELRSAQDAYGVFYAAKGREWDIWCHPDDWDNPGGVAFARRHPIDAARQLLKRSWRADFGFSADED